MVKNAPLTGGEDCVVISPVNATILILALLGNTPANTGSLFSGVWLMDIKPTDSDPQLFSLRRGVFSRGIGKPDFTVKADKKFHRLPTDGFVDAVAITAAGPQKVIERDRFRGKLAYKIVYAISNDGSELTRYVTDFSKPYHKPIVTTISYRRSGQYGKKHHPLNGRWQTSSIVTTREHLTQRLNLIGNRFSMLGAGGYGFDAIIGGPPVSIRGDAATGRAAITMPNENTIVEHMSLDGVATVEMTMIVIADGQTIKVVGTRLTDGTHFGWLMHKQ